MTRKAASPTNVSAELIAVLVAVSDGVPMALTVQSGRALPSGPFEVGHRSLQSGLRAWAEQRTGHALGYLEQLYTFADRERGENGSDGRHISISYLGLTRAEAKVLPGAGWRPWYDYFPWEDFRAGAPNLIAKTLAPRLEAWAAAGETGQTRESRRIRAEIAFGLGERRWNEELTLQRYELLWEAGFAEEVGESMVADHRRILATGIARLRAKIKYNPVVFELMPPIFTMLQLQRCVEAIAGLALHKPNFRRLVEQQQLVEETGEMVADTGGRPAKAYQFRKAVTEQRAIAGTKLPIARA